MLRHLQHLRMVETPFPAYAHTHTHTHTHLPLSCFLLPSHTLSFIAFQCIDVTDMKTYPATIRLIFWLIYQKQCLSCLIPAAIKHNILFNMPTDTTVFPPVIWYLTDKTNLYSHKAHTKEEWVFPSNSSSVARAAGSTVPSNEGSVYFLKWMCLTHCAHLNSVALSNLLKKRHLTNHSVHITA